MEALSEAGLQGSEALAKASAHTYAQSFQQALKNGATFDQALKQATADTTMETITWQAPLKDLLDDIKGDPKKARTEIDKALKRDGIHMTPVELQWLGAVAAEASFLQYDANFYKKIALEMMTGMDYETAHAVASRKAWQEAAREMSVIEVTSSQREGMGADNGRQGNRMASTSENPAAAIDRETVSKYDKENGQKVWDYGEGETNQGILRRGYPVGDSGGDYAPDIVIGKSLSAKAKNYNIMDLQTGERYRFVEGTRIQNVEVFAGKGTKVEFRIAQKYADAHGGRPEDWQHVKGFGVLATPDGDMEAEVHWAQCQGVGKFDFFVKRWIGE